MAIPTPYTAVILNHLRQYYNIIEDVLAKHETINIFKNVLKDLKDSYLAVFREIEIGTDLGAKR